MTRRAWTLLFAALLSGGAASVLPAQAAAPVTIDRIVAVVGKTPILESQVDEELFARQNDRQLVIPSDTAGITRLRRQYTDTLISAELLYQEALKDTMVKVTDQQVVDAVEAQVRAVRRQFPTELQFTQELQATGFATLDDWKKLLIEQQHRALVIQAFRQRLTDQGKLKPLPPSMKEMRAWYDEKVRTGYIDSLPPTVSIRQIIVAPKPGAEAKAKARAFADSLAKALRTGDSAAFANAAKRYSMDPGSAASGGDLGWQRRGAFLPEFDRAVFTLPVGTISDPVETSYGFHVIQVVRRRAAEVDARHILITPRIDTAEARAAHTLADSIRGLLAKGANFDSLQFLYHDPIEAKESDGVPIDSLPAEYRQALAGLDSNQVAPVFELPAGGDPLRSKWAVVQVKGRAPAGARSFDSVRDFIRTILGRENAEHEYINELRQKTYIEIRGP